MDPHWYRDFFSGIALDLWRNATPDESTETEVAWLVEALALPSAARVLDVPCGNGRHARALTRAGHQVTGLDLSEEFLDEARTRSREAGLDVAWIHGDMADLDAVGPFHGALCMGNSFGYLEHADTLRFLGRVGELLERGGRFAIDTGMVAESILPDFQGNRWLEVGDILLLVENRYDAVTSRLETVYHFVRDGHVERRHGRHQVYTLAELGRMLATAGMQFVSTASSLDGEPFEPGCPRLLLVAEKR